MANRKTQTITVDKGALNDPARTVQLLSHESGHAMYTPKDDFSSRDAYLNSKLSDEGAATLNNIKVQREILANGGRISAFRAIRPTKKAIIRFTIQLRAER
jgi:type VI secretion system secreted protein VgrG